MPVCVLRILVVSFVIAGQLNFHELKFKNVAYFKSYPEYVFQVDMK